MVLERTVALTGFLANANVYIYQIGKGSKIFFGFYTLGEEKGQE